MTVAASPKPSEAPKPVIVWNVLPPLMVAELAANAGAGPVGPADSGGDGQRGHRDGGNRRASHDTLPKSFASPRLK
jgi:hypothetical protein